MVVTELTLTTALLVGAGLMVRSFMTLYSVDLGIRVDDVMTVRVRLPEAKYRTPDARRAFFDRLEPRLAAIPGVAAAAVTTGVPPHDGGERLLETDGPAHTADWRPVFVGTVTITPRFFAVLGVPSLRGRTFKSLDGAPGRETVIINERLAAQFFPGEDPIGRRLRFVTRDWASGPKTSGARSSASCQHQARVPAGWATRTRSSTFPTARRHRRPPPSWCAVHPSRIGHGRGAS